jgi:hypothetical protein
VTVSRATDPRSSPATLTSFTGHGAIDPSTNKPEGILMLLFTIAKVHRSGSAKSANG